MPNPPSLPAEFPRPEWQQIIDALNLRLFSVEQSAALLTTTGPHREAVGKETIVAESQVEIEHGLGAEPVNVQVTLLLNENTSISSPYVKSVTASKITIRNPSAKAINVYWRALT